MCVREELNVIIEGYDDFDVVLGKNRRGYVKKFKKEEVLHPHASLLNCSTEIT